MSERDLHERSQILAAIINVVMHDLRNRLHSATLLVEAMGADKASLEGMRTRLRAQLTKLNATITDASDMAKEINLESRTATSAVGPILAEIRERAELPNQRLVLHSSDELDHVEVRVDFALVVAAVTTVAERLTSLAREASAPTKPTVFISASANAINATEVRLTVGFAELDASGERSVGNANEGATGAEFPEIPASDFDLALARTLAENGGASLRLERTGPSGGPVFVLRLPKA